MSRPSFCTAGDPAAAASAGGRHGVQMPSLFRRARRGAGTRCSTLFACAGRWPRRCRQGPSPWCLRHKAEEDEEENGAVPMVFIRADNESPTGSSNSSAAVFFAAKRK